MPENWYNKTIGGSVRIIKGVTYASSDYARENEGDVFLTIKCFAKGGGFNAHGVKYFRGLHSLDQEVKPGELLIAKTDLTRAGDIIGSPMIAPDFGDGKKVLPSMDLSVLRPLKDDVDIRFLFYRLMLGDARRFMWAHSAGSTVLHLESKALPKFAFQAPGSDEQRRLREILCMIDATLEQTKLLIAKNEQIKEGMMHDLFTRGVAPDGNLRAPFAEAPDLYKETRIGWIPTGWDCVTTENRVRVIDAQPDHRTPPEVREGYPYIGIGDIAPSGEVVFNEARKVSAFAFQKQLASFEIGPGAFIFGKIGTLGSPTRIPHERFFALSANVVLLTSKVREDADFVFWVYNSQLIDRQVADATNTTSQPALGIQKIRKFMMPWPSSKTERRAIASRLEAVLRSVQSLEKEKQKCLLLKRGLMKDLLTGHVPVKVPADGRREADAQD